MKPLRVVFCWSHVSGYMAACWRALGAREDVAFGVTGYAADESVANAAGATAFDESVVAGLPIRLLNSVEQRDYALIRSLVIESDPDVVVLPGWLNRAYVRLASDPELARARFFMTMDTPWRGTVRQRAARLRIGGYLGRMHRVVVAGERAWQFARHLGVPESNIRRGQYGVDCDALSPLHHQRTRLEGGWPKRFLFAGRYESEKGVDVLMEGYRAYRAKATEPWPLVGCGAGPLLDRFRSEPGVEHRGFVQPADMISEWLHAGAFVLPSRYDPWPLAIVEACAAGLPVIHSEACGSAVEVVRPYFNGLGVATDRVYSLAAAFQSIQDCYGDLPTWGLRSQSLAAPYSARQWAQRWASWLREA